MVICFATTDGCNVLIVVGLSSCLVYQHLGPAQAKVKKPYKVHPAHFVLGALFFVPVLPFVLGPWYIVIRTPNFPLPYNFGLWSNPRLIVFSIFSLSSPMRVSLGARTHSVPIPAICSASLMYCTNFGWISSSNKGKNQR